MTVYKRELRSPASFPQSRRPSHVQPLERPVALAKASELAFLRFETPDLDATERFLSDFGMRTTVRNADRLVMRGTGSAACVYVATRGAKARYLGSAFVVPTQTELQAIVSESGAKWLPPESIPGGGRGIELVDPSGHALWLLVERPEVDPLPRRQSLYAATNTVEHKPRVNAGVRAPIEPAAVVRIGHLAIQTTDFGAMAHWYMRHLGLIPTDVQYLADGSPAICFFRLDLGERPADHHTFVIVGGLEDKYEHSAYEVIDLDAVGQGQQVLRAGGHRHLWGIGRHVLGSQIFDYWVDPNGFQFEHYADGDVYTADYETQYSQFDLGSIWAWGQDVPKAMRPRKTPAMLWRVVRLLLSKRLTPQRLKLFGQALEAPARPWL
jgi:catechol 2,3-dioxygenase-like lactoylglutathione lyase family enzyme